MTIRPIGSTESSGLGSCYQLQVKGHIDHHWSSWFGSLSMSHEANGNTTLTGPVTDQAELHGLLSKIRDLGLILISLVVVDPPGGREPALTPLEGP